MLSSLPPTAIAVAPIDANATGMNDSTFNATKRDGKEQFCLLTMADEKHRQKYHQNLQSHECYAQRHGYIYAVEDCVPIPGRPPTLRKHDVLKKWARDGRCTWLVWIDADMFIADYLRPLDSFVPADSSVQMIMKDDPNILNNGMFFLRNSAWMRTIVLPMWRSIDFDEKKAWPFTDNGSMLELLLRVFVPRYRSHECGAPPFQGLQMQSWRYCVSRRISDAFGGDTCLRPNNCTGVIGRIGPMSANHRLLLRHPLDAFNYHACEVNQVIHRCDHPSAQQVYWQGIGREKYWKDMQPFGDRFLDFMFVPPLLDGASWKPQSFSLHSKVPQSLGASFIKQVTDNCGR